MSERKPRLAMVSIGIRRDLLAPLGHLDRLELTHFYKEAVYGDLTARDIDSTLHRYTSPLDLYKQLVAAQPDVIQSVEPFSFYTQPYLWACLAAARKTGAALLVVTFENRPLEIRFGKPRAAVLRWVSGIYFARASWIIVLNRGASENVLTCGAAPEKLIRTLWGTWGVDLNEFYPRKSRIPDAPPTILFVGRLHPEKGVFVLLDAFAQVHEKCPTARLCVLGDGPARADMEHHITTRDLADSVELMGMAKNRDVPDFFRRADVFCAPSLTTRKWAEQVGVSAMQAMASGVPVVSTRSGAIPEYVPDGVAGVLVEENNPTDLADALLDLLEHPDRARALGEGGRAYAMAHYDASRNIERAETLILEKLNRL